MTELRLPREHGLPFKPPLITSLMRDVDPKTQTRRALTDRNTEGNVKLSQCDLSSAWVDPGIGGGPYLKARVLRDSAGVNVADEEIIERIYPRYHVGDRIWAREMFSPFSGGCTPSKIKDASYVLFRDGAQKSRSGEYSPGLKWYAPGAFNGTKFRPSIHMPRWAARVVLEITDVRIQRVKDITEPDAKAEGVEPDTSALARYTPYMSGFAHTWQEINGPRGLGFDANPWVVALTFTRVAAA